MLNKLSEEDFLVLRKPLESKRQSPISLGAVFVLAIFCQALLLYLEWFISGFSNLPLRDIVFQFHFMFSCILGGLSLIYSIPIVYRRYQRIQYLISIIVSQNLFGISSFLLSIIAIGTEMTDDGEVLLQFSIIMFFIGIIVFIITSIRFYLLLQQGKYRKGTYKDKQRNTWESKSVLPIIIPIGIGITFIIQFMIRNFELMQIDLIFIVILEMTIFNVMIFVLPEQLVILYCKYRFDSFNYDLSGRIKPVRD
ncbi:hypothetical protein [Gracilibacillus kekensis]|uniref:Uncharacterized protein n=1 Tax=Gracilibacillus kekensis TaxID=1027249 RepID=A0A1M7JNN5_9BACI|nr:hypothetical protein [Gracilibacillus kekensis]SHM54618.1 hypothetical protein SAMN05216179_0427 [Gracilibacillus kekensis]